MTFDDPSESNSDSGPWFLAGERCAPRVGLYTIQSRGLQDIDNLKHADFTSGSAALEAVNCRAGLIDIPFWLSVKPAV